MEAELPKSWLPVKLGEISEITYGKGLSTKQLLPEGYPVFGANGVIGFYDRYLYEFPQLLISCRGANSGTINISPKESFITNNSLIVGFSVCRESLVSLLYYFLQAADKSKLITGTAQPQVTINNAVELAIHLPPLNEQRRIVAKIEELFSEIDAGVASLKTARAQLGVYRQSLLKQAFEGKLTEKWRTQNPDKLEPAEQLLARIRREREARYQQQLTDWQTAVQEWEAGGKEGKKPAKPRKPKEVAPLAKEELENLSPLPEGWIWQRLAQNAVVVSDGPFGSNLKTSDYVGQGVRVVRLENIGYNEFIDCKESFITPEKYETIKRHTVYPHDIVFSSFILDAVRAAKIPDSIDFAVNKADCFCIHAYGESLTSDYLSQMFSARYFFKSLESLIHGVGRPRINTTQLGEAPTPICSLPEQQEIIRILEEQFTAIEQNEAEIDAALQRAEALRQSILKKAFAGKLVDQDPNDEPASVLLERIRAEREAVEAELKAKKKATKKTAKARRKSLNCKKKT